MIVVGLRLKYVRLVGPVADSGNTRGNSKGEQIKSDFDQVVCSNNERAQKLDHCIELH